MAAAQVVDVIRFTLLVVLTLATLGLLVGAALRNKGRK